MEFLILSCVLWLFFTWFFLIQSVRLISTRRKLKLPPGPKPLPIIGNLLDLDQDKPHMSLANLAKAHGPIISLKLGVVTAVVVSSAEMVKEVLQTHDQILSFRAVPDALTAYDHGELSLPWIPVSTLWRKMRRICNNRLFSGTILDSNENLRRNKLEELVANVRQSAVKGEVVDIGEVIFATTLNLISYTICSMDLAEATSEIAQEFKATMRGILEEAARPNISDFFPVLRKMDVQGIRRRTTAHFCKIFDLIDQIIDQRLEMQKSPDFTPKNDMLHQLLNMGEEDNSHFNIRKDEIRHLILVLFTAGADTTTTVVQWAMAHLLRNPEIMSQAKEEIRKVIGRGNRVEESHIDKLPYLQAIVKETMRLQAALLLPRLAEAEVTIAGFTIPKGTQVIVNTWALGRDPKVWENPDSFTPERFLGPEIDIGGRNFEFIPFGAGRRICPGRPLAIRMLHLLVSSLIHWFDWKLEDGITPENLNMDEKFGLSAEMAQPLRAVPLLA